MNASHVPRSGSSERVDIINGILEDSNNSGTKKSLRACSLTVLSAGILFTVAACLFLDSEWNRRLSSAPDFTHLAGHYMDCGTAPLCGVLTLETGYGPGYYNHPKPGVHGLWPQTGHYGSSQCLPPKSALDPTKIHSCYDEDGDTIDHEKWFEDHEWEKHGICAGVSTADAFFDVVCNLSKAPLTLMAKVRKQHPSDQSLEPFLEALESAGYSIFDRDDRNKQILLSACATKDGNWILANASEFSAKCGGQSNANVAMPH